MKLKRYRNTLSPQEKALLIHCLQEHNPPLLSQVELLGSGNIQSDTINDMRDAIGDELAGKGFRPDSEPNEYGLELEELIDRLASLYLWPEGNSPTKPN